MRVVNLWAGNPEHMLESRLWQQYGIDLDL